MIMTFKPGRMWFDDKKSLATRIAQIIGYSDVCPPFMKKDGVDTYDENRWTLNVSNDWWLGFNPTDRTCELSYRYKYDEDQWAALKKVIEMFLR